MAKSQNSIYKVKCFVDSELRNLICKKSRAKNEIDQELEYMSCLLEADLVHAGELFRCIMIL